MAVFGVKGLQQSTCLQGLLSGQKHGSSNFSSDSCFLHHLPLKSSVVPSMAWNTDKERRHVKLKAQGPKQMLQSGNYPYDGQSWESIKDPSNPFAPGIYIDLLNRMSVRTPMLETTNAVVADQRKRRLKAFQQKTRDFVDGLVQHISSHNDNYKYFITAIRENANIIMEQGFMSSSARDEILSGLECIEKDIGEGKFKWINDADVRVNIIEALIKIVGDPAKRLDAISHYDQLLEVLQIWCRESIDKFITQIKELQLELVLLAIRNERLVLCHTQSSAKRILLGDLVLSKLEQLEMNVSRLLSCKDKMNFEVLTALPSGNLDPENSISKGVIDFGNMIVVDIAHDLSNLEWELASWVEGGLLTPNDTVTRSHLLMKKSMLDLDKFTAVRSPYSIHVPTKDNRERFLAVYKIIPEVLKAASGFLRSASFNQENIQYFFLPAFSASGGPAGLHAIERLICTY